MFHRRLNELRVTVQIDPAPPSPLMIKEGGDGEEAAPDAVRTMECVRSGSGAGKQVYIPGSSLRGVLRSEMTQIVSRWDPAWTMVSDPFRNAAAHWAERARAGPLPPTSAEIYRMAGPIERCLGMTGLRGRWGIDDAWPLDPAAVGNVLRPGLAIDRDTGANRSSLTFTSNPIARGTFETTITLVNYELWQLGLLAHALARIDDGHVRLGYGRRRGFGRVRLSVASMAFRWYGHVPAPGDDGKVPVPSLARLAADAGIGDGYGWRDGDQHLALELRADKAVAIGSGWTLDPGPPAPGDADAWAAEPWPTIGPLLGQVMSEWSPAAGLVDLANELHAERGAA